VRPDEERELPLRRALDRICLDPVRNPFLGPVALAQERRASRVPGGRLQDDDRQPAALDVAVEVRKELVLLAGRQSGSTRTVASGAS
jgi:hypothetical protein